MSTVVRVLVADDHPVYRKGLRAVLESVPHIRISDEVQDGDLALTALLADPPDVAVLDHDMPGKSGLELAHEVRDRHLPVKVVLITGHKDESLVNKAIDAGVAGYVLKDGALTEILECIQAVQAGRRYVSPHLAGILLNRRARVDALVERTPTIADLTETERKVLACVAEGKTSKETGALLFMSSRTAEHHRASIAAKLNLRGANALMRFAVEHKSDLAN